MTQATLPPATTVTGPGVYSLPPEVYHADPVPGGSLSSTGARKLLPPSCPALFRYEREHPEPTRKVWEIGSAAHKLVLGVGPNLVLVEDEWGADPNAWRTDKVKAKLAEIRERGDIPLKRPEWDQVHEMAQALRGHPFAGKLFAPDAGEAEQTLVWAERATVVNPEPAAEGEMQSLLVPCRALVDWLPSRSPGRMIVPDYKTCISAAPMKVERAIADHGYHIQLRFYLRGLQKLGLADDRAEGVLVMQEKTPPYLVTVVQPDATAMRMADIRIREALDIYAQCTATGRWPGYSDDVVLAELPPWETKELRGEVW